MDQIIKAKDHKELAKFLMQDRAFTVLVPKTKRLHDFYLLNMESSTHNEMYSRYQLYYLANELSQKQNQNFDIEFLQDFNWLKLIILYFSKFDIGGTTDTENAIISKIIDFRNNVMNGSYSKDWYGNSQYYLMLDQIESSIAQYFLSKN